MVESYESEHSGASPDSEFTPPTRQQWMEAAIAGLGSGDSSADSDNEVLQQLQRTTLEGIPLEVLYDTAQASFSTGAKPSVTDPWDNRLSVHIDGTTGAANARIVEGLKGGITSIELHVTDPAHIAPCLQTVQLNIAPVSLRASQAYQSCAASLAQLAADQGSDKQNLRCNLNADPLGNWLRTGIADQPMAKQLQQMASFASANITQLPLATSILVDTTLHHNAGASTVEELHAAIATATLYLEAMLNSGVSINDACHQIVFQIAVDADVLLEIAKLRALQALWQHVVLQIDSTATVGPVTIIAETSKRFISQLEPWNNHLRNLAASTAAAMGGASTLIVHPHDALQCKDDQHDPALGERIARNIAIILERECGLSKVHDPMAGSYAIENLTDQLMQQTWQSLADTDTGEGWLDELQSGRWQTRLANTQKQRVMLMENEKRIAIGINRYVHTNEPGLSIKGIQTNAKDDNQTSAVLTPVRDSASFEIRLAQQSGQAAKPEISS